MSKSCDMGSNDGPYDAGHVTWTTADKCGGHLILIFGQKYPAGNTRRGKLLIEHMDHGIYHVTSHLSCSNQSLDGHVHVHERK